MLDQLEASELDLKVLFLEADEETLLSRYKETAPPPSARPKRANRRWDPRGAPPGALERADVVIDATSLTGSALRRRIATELIRARRPETNSR